MLEENALPMMKNLKNESTKDSTFFSPIKRNKYICFEDANTKTVVKKNGKQKEVSCQRDILGLVVKSSYASKKPVDVKKGMTYP